MRKETGIKGFVKWWGVCLAVILAVSVIGPRAYAQEKRESTGNFNVFIGGKFLEEEDWAPAENHFELGLQMDVRPTTWPVSIVIDWSYSWESESEYMLLYDPWYGYYYADFEFEARTMELDPGVRYIYEGLAYFRPYIGAGLAVIWAEAEGSALGITLSEDDWSIGFWAGGGAYVTLAEHLNLGFQAKYSYAKVELFDVTAESGGWHLGGLVGYHW